MNHVALRQGPGIPSLFLLGLAFAAAFSTGRADTTVLDWTMNDGAVPTGIVSSSSQTVSVVSNSTLDPTGTGNNVLQFSTGVSIFTLGSSYDLTTGSTLTLAINFGYASAATTNSFDIGMFDNNGTASTTSANVTSNAANDSGIWTETSYTATAKNLAVQPIAETGTNAGIFAGTDRTYGTSKSISASTPSGDTNPHTLVLTYSWNGSAYVMGYTLDGTAIGTDTASLTFNPNELALNVKSGSLQLDDVTVTVSSVPEPKTAWLMLGGGGLLLLAGAAQRGRLRAGMAG